MAKKLYEESNIKEIGNALRRKLGNTVVKDVRVYAYSDAANASGHDNCPLTSSRPTVSDTYRKCFHVPGAAKFVIVMTTAESAAGYFYAGYINTSDPTNNFPDGYTTTNVYSNKYKETIVLEGSEYLSFKLSANSDSDYGKSGYFCQIVAFDANGNAIDFNSGTTSLVTMEVKNTFKTADMGSAVDSITTGSGTESTFTTKDITENGTYNASTDDGVDGYSSVSVNVVPPVAEKTFTENGVYYATNDEVYGYNKVTVNVGFTPNLQSKTVYIENNGDTTITCDDGYDGLGTVTARVNVDTSGGTAGSTIVGSLLEERPVVYEKTPGTNIDVIGQDTVSFSTVSSKRNSTSSRAWYPTGVAVGDDIYDHLTSSSFSSSTVYGCGGYYMGTSTKPSKDSFLKWGGGYGTGTKYIVYKYNTASSGNYNDTLGNLVLYDRNGICLFVGSWEDGLAALNNKEINISNGVFFCTDKVLMSTSNSTISINFA